MNLSDIPEHSVPFEQAPRRFTLAAYKCTTERTGSKKNNNKNFFMKLEKYPSPQRWILLNALNPTAVQQDLLVWPERRRHWRRCLLVFAHERRHTSVWGQSLWVGGPLRSGSITSGLPCVTAGNECKFTWHPFSLGTPRCQINTV